MSVKSNRGKSASRSFLPAELARFLRRTGHDQPDPPKSNSNAVYTEPSLATGNIATVPVQISDYEVLCGDSPISNLRRIHRSCPPHTNSLPKPYDSPDTMSRRFSWLPFGKSNTARTETTSPSMSISETNSMSFVAESAISSPVLTSTTNTHIARSENVRCSKISLSTHSIKMKAGGDDPQHGQHCLDTSGELNTDPKTIDNKHFDLASTLQSVRKKIKHVRRASTSFLFENARPRGLRENNSMLATNSEVSQYASQSGEAPCLPRLQSGSTTDLLTGSLSEFFTNGNSKFDAQALPADPPSAGSLATSKLKYMRSRLSLHGVNSDFSKSVDVMKGTSKSLGAADSHNPNALRSLQQSNLLTAINKTINTQAQKPTIASSKSVQLRFSGKKNRYVRAKPDLSSPHGVNPLTMHPEVNTLARPPSERTFPSTPNHKPKRDSSDDDGSEKIECAIIYSPSTGNLSEYSRKTSSPTLKDGTRQGQAQQETPTRRPLHKRSGSVLKRSVSSLITKSTSLLRLSNLTPSRRFKQESNSSLSAKWTSHPESHKGVDEGKPDARIRGRAMSSPNLYCPEGLRAVWDYQPSTPSPLRKTTKMSEINWGRPRAVTTNASVNVLADRTDLLETEMG